MTRSFSRPGTSPPNRSQSACPRPIRLAGLGVVEAGRLDDLLQLLAVGARVVRGRGVAREQRRGHHVDPLVGGLRGQDRRDEQLERGLEVQLGVHVRIEHG